MRTFSAEILIVDERGRTTDLLGTLEFPGVPQIGSRILAEYEGSFDAFVVTACAYDCGHARTDPSREPGIELEVRRLGPVGERPWLRNAFD